MDIFGILDPDLHENLSGSATLNANHWSDPDSNSLDMVDVQDFRDVLNDVTLYCGGQKVCANRLVLCACSQVGFKGTVPTRFSISIFFSVSDPYSLNPDPDPAKISIRIQIRIHANFSHRLKHLLEIEEKKNVVHKTSGFQ